MKHKKIEPTRTELEILRLIWQHGPSTVRFINDAQNEQGRDVNYTTTLKLMQVMAEKGILLRDKSQVKHVYRAAEDEQQTKRHLLDRFITTLYNGSASKLMLQLIGENGHKKLSEAQLEEFKRLVNELEDDENDADKPNHVD